ncbi:MAG: DUF4276 family protein [Leptospiraceae bacterium]|nr:DUF4276 family protein [Leptospiraceae bacterium]MCP5493636.1 DUF4276 family protein [Leptospiraceae bacterium]
MRRLIVHVEGETEEMFVNEILAPYLRNYGYTNVSARLIGNARNRSRRGGIRDWKTVKQEILNHLRNDPNCISTIMVDYYALPKDWPGRGDAEKFSFPQKAEYIQNELAEDIRSEMGSGFNPSRFIPNVVMHEFEGLLFSDPASFARGIGKPRIEAQLQQIRNQFSTPEEINDSSTTAPSKRIEQIIPNYEKPILGTLAILEIGLLKIKEECPNFHRWILNLENS